MKHERRACSTPRLTQDPAGTLHARDASPVASVVRSGAVSARVDSNASTHALAIPTCAAEYVVAPRAAPASKACRARLTDVAVERLEGRTSFNERAVWREQCVEVGIGMARLTAFNRAR